MASKFDHVCRTPEAQQPYEPYCMAIKRAKAWLAFQLPEGVKPPIPDGMIRVQVSGVVYVDREPYSVFLERVRFGSEKFIQQGKL